MGRGRIAFFGGGSVVVRWWFGGGSPTTRHKVALLKRNRATLVLRIRN